MIDNRKMRGRSVMLQKFGTRDNAKSRSITVDGWVTYLSGEINGATGLLANIIGIAVAACALMITFFTYYRQENSESFSPPAWVVYLAIIVLLVFLLLFPFLARKLYNAYIDKIDKKRAAAGRVLKGIMTGS